jgi:pimeloyl-ACP methyl ester carboxylesterase
MRSTDQMGHAAEPDVFSQQAGLFVRAKAGGDARNVAVLFLNPWGFEEMCARRFYRSLADTFAENDVSSLRFDYPGTANALDVEAIEGTLDLWLESIAKAAKRLSLLAGTPNIVIVGQGLGASLALLSKIDHPKICGIALLAPVLSGRAYLRELSLWATMIDDGLGIPPRLRETGPGVIAGLHMPGDLATSVRGIDLTSHTGAPATEVFLARRSGNARDEAYAARLEAGGYKVQATEFNEYDALVNNPLNQVIPTGLPVELMGWLKNIEQFDAPLSAPSIAPSIATPLIGPDFRESPVRFGTFDHLSGSLCEPVDGASRATVVFLTTGYDPQAGWARFSTQLARRLAAVGIASLRFDSADVGDSAPVAGRRAQILYDHQQVNDVISAFDFVAQANLSGPTLLFGRCSGAYLALHSALADIRCNACIAVNPVVFRWFQAPTEEMVLRPARSFKDYSAKAFQFDTFRRILKGQVDVPTATRHMMTRLSEKATKVLAPLLGSALPKERWNQSVHDDFRQLAARNTPVALIYSEADEGLESFRYHFGQNGSQLSPYLTAEWHVVPDADHNFTLSGSREALSEIVETLALSLVEEPLTIEPTAPVAERSFPIEPLPRMANKG